MKRTGVQRIPNTPQSHASIPTTAGNSPRYRKPLEVPKTNANLVNTIRTVAPKPSPFARVADSGKRKLETIGRWHASSSPLANRTTAYSSKKEVSGSRDASQSQLQDVLFSMNGCDPIVPTRIGYHNAESPPRSDFRASKCLSYRQINPNASEKIFKSTLHDVLPGKKPDVPTVFKEKPFSFTPKKRFEIAKRLYTGFAFDSEEGGVKGSELEESMKKMHSKSPKRTGYIIDDRLRHASRAFPY